MDADQRKAHLKVGDLDAKLMTTYDKLGVDIYRFKLTNKLWWELKRRSLVDQEKSVELFSGFEGQTQDKVIEHVRRTLVIMADTAPDWVQYALSMDEPGETLFISLFIGAVKLDAPDVQAGLTSEDYRRIAREARATIEDVDRWSEETRSRSPELSTNSDELAG